MGGSVNVTFNQIQTTTESTTTLAGSRVSVGDKNTFESKGNVGGSGSFDGSFANDRKAVIMANGENGATTIDVDGDFVSSGTIFFNINSRDLSAPGAITQVNSGKQVDFEGGRACICLDPSLKFKEGDEFDLVTAKKSLNGKFDQVEFDCKECPRRSAKSVESSGTSVDCKPSSNYGGTSFSVLFDACDKDGDYLDSISPPYYVIIPVAVGIVVIVVLVFGGALVLEKRFRKKQIKKRNQANNTRRRQRAVAQMKRSATQGSSSMTV